MSDITKTCVIGSPVEHSLSPFIHNAGYKELNLNWKYSREEVDKSNFVQRIGDLISQGYVGFNITMPCKVEAFKFCNIVDGSAKRLKSVNTIVLRGGLTHGYSTDGEGFINFLKDENIDFVGKKISIIGSGGASSLICDSLYHHGSHITICARNEIAANSICENVLSFNIEVDKNISSIISIALDDAGQVIADSDIIINATPVGMKTNKDEINVAPFNIELLNNSQIVIDTIYHPLETYLLKGI